MLVWFEEGREGGMGGRRAGKGRFWNAHLEGDGVDAARGASRKKEREEKTTEERRSEGWSEERLCMCV